MGGNDNGSDLSGGNESLELKTSWSGEEEDKKGTNGNESFGLDNSVSKLPGSSLVRATGADQEGDAAMHASNISTKTWKSNQTVHIDGDGSYVKEDGSDDPTPPSSPSDARDKKKDRLKEQNYTSWFQKLLEKPEERQRRIQNEKLIARQTSSRWGMDIDEEDSTAHVDEEDNLQPTPKEQQEGENNDDEKAENRRPGLWNVGNSVRNFLQKGSDEELDIIDEENEKSVNTSNTARSAKSGNNNNNNLGTALSTFWEHTFAKFDPKVHADPQFQASIQKIESVRAELQTLRATRRHKTLRRQRQIINSIQQQKQFFVTELRTTSYRYRRDPFAPCVKEVYEAEILRVVHGIIPEEEAEDNGSDNKDDMQQSKRRESVWDIAKRDGIDMLLDSCNFDYGYAPPPIDEETEESFDDVDPQPVDHATLIPFETKVLRAQHNEWMTENQMELTRNFEQQFVQHLLSELLPKLREEAHALPESEEWKCKLEDARKSNAELTEAYQAHIAAQERLLAVYREHDTDKEADGENLSQGGSFDDGNISPLASPVVSAKATKSLNGGNKPNPWLKNLFPKLGKTDNDDGEAEAEVSDTGTGDEENKESISDDTTPKDVVVEDA
mmetsp:Transcript_31430/g.73961  ORF Transcript_31430/g.73961 Transcript_31430/m.73961 type:complete len:613 (+) Transcript_31430:225-2063(+)